MRRRSVLIDSEEVDIDIIRSSRKTVALYVRPGGAVQVRAPWYVPVGTLMRFVTGKSRWIAKQRERMKTVAPPGTTAGLHDGSHLSYFGKEIILRVKKSERNYLKVSDGFLEAGISSDHNEEMTQKLVEGWYLAEAKKYLPARVREIQSAYRHLLPEPAAVNTRKMKRRWGTCRNNGVIWLNRELIKKEVELIDYVIIHELCHLVHHNHGKEYYELLSRILPDYKILRERLNKG